MKKLILSAIFFSVIIISCDKDNSNNPVTTTSTTSSVDTAKKDTTTKKPELVLIYKFDSTQARLNNFGQPLSVPAGNAAQSPRFNLMGAHYIELSKADHIAAYGAEQLYRGPEKNGSPIDFENALYGKDGETFFKIELEKVTPAIYKYLRVSLSYQNFDIKFSAKGLDLTGTLASFVGSKTYIGDYTIKNEKITVNGEKTQGYWGFETNVLNTPFVYEGQAPVTTVPNPIAATSGIPPGSCLVTGVFPTPLTITGKETEDITVEVAISINNSFEWKDNGDGKYDPDVDKVVDMGVRGMIPVVK